MKTTIFTIFLTATALWLSSCSTGRIASATEYDSVYFGRTDNIVYNDAQPQDGEDNQSQQYARQGNDTDESRDDDFYYSRRVRRFGNDNNDWRYYDPYYSNDLYYSMGTPSWNTWNNNGWYNPTSPFIGSPWNGYNGMSGFGYGFGNGFYGYNSPYTWGGYNPWINTYYGYSPWTAGYCGYNYGMYNPYYYSMYSPWNNPYCPYTYVNQGSTSIAVGTVMPNRGVTSGLAPATSLVNSGGGRPSLGGRNTGGQTVISNETGGSTVGGVRPASTKPSVYTTPRSNVEFDNRPPKTYTPSETRPTTSPTRTWTTPSDTRPNTSPTTSPSQATRPPVYSAPSGTRSNTSPATTRPQETPKVNTSATKPPRSEPVRSERPSPNFSAPSRSEPSRSEPSRSEPSRSGGSSSGGGHRPR